MSRVRVPEGVPFLEDEQSSSRNLDKVHSIWYSPNAVGVSNGEGPPVPIPNTEVKLISAEDTCLATDWKNRSVPTQSLRFSEAFFIK